MILLQVKYSHRSTCNCNICDRIISGKRLEFYCINQYACLFKNMDRVKRIWYLSPMRAAKVQASLRIRAVSPEPPLLAHTSSESRGTFKQKARSLAPLNGWACAVKICHDGMLGDTNSPMIPCHLSTFKLFLICKILLKWTAFMS